MKNAISPRMTNNCVCSSIFLITLPFKKSSVNVDADVMTSDESVEIDAANTSTMTMPTRRSEKPDSMDGMMESKPPAFTLAPSAKSLPKPPKK